MERARLGAEELEGRAERGGRHQLGVEDGDGPAALRPLLEQAVQPSPGLGAALVRCLLQVVSELRREHAVELRAARLDAGDLGQVLCANGTNAHNPVFSRSRSAWIAAARGWQTDPTQENALLLSAMIADSRPLTEPRHWRRAQGRKAKVELADETLVARIGELVGDEIRLVLPDRSGPVVRAVPLSTVRRAVVEVEFSPPPPRELELAGGVPDGRVAAGELAEGPDDETGSDDHDETNETKVDQ